MDWIEAILMGMTALLVLALLGMAIYGVFWVADNAFTERHTTHGTIAAVEFYPAHRETYYNVALKIPQTKWVLDQWSVRLDCEEGSDWMDLDEAPARWFANGKTVTVRYARGRLTGGFRALQIFKPETS